LVILPDDHAVELPHDVGFDVGASIGIPALTAHRCLTVGIGQTGRLGLGSLIGRTVLVVGGAGAVGHAAIELATWAGARVVTTVRSEQKAALAALAGADRVVNSVHEDVAAVLRAEAPNGFDLIVEVDPSGNAQIDWGVVGQNGTIVVYADSGGEFTVPVRQAMTLNLRLQFVLIYTVPIEAKNQAVLDVSRAIDDGALRIGADAGLPVRWFSLDRTAEAHAAVDRGAVGKVLIDVDGVSGSA
jgi:NADPH2:quinone reductase